MSINFEKYISHFTCGKVMYISVSTHPEANISPTATVKEILALPDFVIEDVKVYTKLKHFTMRPNHFLLKIPRIRYIADMDEILAKVSNISTLNKRVIQQEFSKKYTIVNRVDKDLTVLPYMFKVYKQAPVPLKVELKEIIRVSLQLSSFDLGSKASEILVVRNEDIIDCRIFSEKAVSSILEYQKRAAANRNLILHGLPILEKICEKYGFKLTTIKGVEFFSYNLSDHHNCIVHDGFGSSKAKLIGDLCEDFKKCLTDLNNAGIKYRGKSLYYTVDIKKKGLSSEEKLTTVEEHDIPIFKLDMFYIL